MPSLVDSIGNFFASIFHAITAVFSSIIAVFQSIIETIFSVIGTAFQAAGTMISGLAQTFEGLLKFLLSKFYRLVVSKDDGLTGDVGNILVIGGVVGALFLYGVYQQRNGKPIASSPAGVKKTN